MLRQYKQLCATLAITLLGLPILAQAHEFWIEPRDFTLDVGERLLADIRVGQELQGSAASFSPKRFESFEIMNGSKRSAVRSAAGDSPAINEANNADGLTILASASTPRSLRYGIGSKFGKFLKKEGIPWVLERHRARGLPEKGFVEAYSRFAKALVKTGSGAGTDRAAGLELELVMLTNPYRETETDLKVSVLWEGKPLADAQLSTFFKPTGLFAGDVVILRYQTDRNGIVTLPRPAKTGVMLLNAVHMIEPDAKTILETGAVWESLWASTTFAIE